LTCLLLLTEYTTGIPPKDYGDAKCCGLFGIPHDEQGAHIQ